MKPAAAKKDKAPKVDPKMTKEKILKLCTDAETDSGLIHVDAKTNTQSIRYGISSGSLVLDTLAGGRFLPSRRIVCIYGREKAGKTTYAIEMAARSIIAGVPVYFLDHENALDLKYVARIFKKHGIEETGFLFNKKVGPWWLWHFYQPDHGEQTMMFVKSYLRKIPKENMTGKPVATFIIDSAASIMSKEKMEHDKKEGVGAKARMFAEELPIVKNLVNKRNCCFLIINQLRERPASMGFGGSPFYEPGGNALRHYTDARYSVSASSSGKTEGGVVGVFDQWIEVKKNKLHMSISLKGQSGLRAGKGLDDCKDTMHYLEMTGQLKNGKAVTARLDQRLKKFIGKKCVGKLLRKMIEQGLRDICCEQVSDGTAVRLHMNQVGIEE